MHKHKCTKCGTIFEHPNSCAGVCGTHDCPNCGFHEPWRYNGTEEADITFFGSRPPSAEARLIIRENLAALL